MSSTAEDDAPKTLPFTLSPWPECNLQGAVASSVAGNGNNFGSSERGAWVAVLLEVHLS
jgi:hypothetical protein